MLKTRETFCFVVVVLKKSEVLGFQTSDVVVVEIGLKRKEGLIEQKKMIF